MMQVQNIIVYFIISQIFFVVELTEKYRIIKKDKM